MDELDIYSYKIISGWIECFILNEHGLVEFQLCLMDHK